jgi:hypothetical protein
MTTTDTAEHREYRETLLREAMRLERELAIFARVRGLEWIKGEYKSRRRTKRRKTKRTLLLDAYEESSPVQANLNGEWRPALIANLHESAHDGLLYDVVPLDTGSLDQMTLVKGTYLTEAEIKLQPKAKRPKTPLQGDELIARLETERKLKRMEAVVLSRTTAFRIANSHLISSIREYEQVIKTITELESRRQELINKLPSYHEGANTAMRSWKSSRYDVFNFRCKHFGRGEQRPLSTTQPHGPAREELEMKGKRAKTETKKSKGEPLTGAAAKAEIQRLLKQLRASEDGKEKRHLRASLRRLGHKGGLGTGRGRPAGKASKASKPRSKQGRASAEERKEEE